MLYAILGALLLGIATGFGVEQFRWTAADDARQKAELEARQVIGDNNEKEIVKYVDRVQTINVPVVTIKRVLVGRVCGPDSQVRVPGIGSPAQGHAADAGDRLAGDLKTSVENREQCQALINEVRAINKKK